MKNDCTYGNVTIEFLTTEYSLQQIQTKKLYFLIPLMTLRYYSITNKGVRKNISFPLTQFLEQCIIIIKEGVRRKHLTEKMRNDIMDSLRKGCYYLFWKEGETLEEVQRVIGPPFRFEREIWEEEITEEVTERVTQDGIKKMIRSLKNCGVSRENTKTQLMIEYGLSETEAEEKIKLYFE